MTEAEFKKLSVKEQVELANKRCDELNGRKLTERFRTADFDVDYQTVAKILNRKNYTLFRGRFYKVLVDEETDTRPIIAPVEDSNSKTEENKDELFDLVKQVMSMKNTRSAYYKITQELLDKWNKFRNEKFDYVSSGNLIVMAMLDFMNKHK